MAFGGAIGVIVVWGLTGPLFHFGNTWLLVINTGASIITFLMIFLIRSAQNRESEAVQLKLDELIRATKEARNTLLDIEELSEEELDRIKARFEVLGCVAIMRRRAAALIEPAWLVTSCNIVGLTVLAAVISPVGRLLILGCMEILG